jgi:hypothetical protein
MVFDCISRQPCKKPPSGTKYMYKANGWVEMVSENGGTGKMEGKWRDRENGGTKWRDKMEGHHTY